VKISEQVMNVAEKIGHSNFDVAMCAITLAANGVLSPDDTMQRAQRYWTETLDESCVNCPCIDKCIVNTLVDYAGGGL
jgi:hypothetical protein